MIDYYKELFEGTKMNMTELERVKESYINGELDSLRIQLENFISCNKDQIMQFKLQEEKLWKCHLDIATAIKLFILKVRTIDTVAEMQDQMKEINLESDGTFDKETEQNSHCNEWIKQNAAIWREYRVLAIIYVFDQNESYLLAKIINI